MDIAANSRTPSIAFYVRLGPPVLQVVALSARLDEISLLPAAQSKPIFGHLALLPPPARAPLRRYGQRFDVICQDRFSEWSVVHFMCILCALMWVHGV
jgi:hypothetical protein